MIEAARISEERYHCYVGAGLPITMGEQFYINYSLNGEHYAMGPYHTRRFAMSHIEDVRRQAGASNVYLGNKPPEDKSYRKLVPITMAMGLR